MSLLSQQPQQPCVIVSTDNPKNAVSRIAHASKIGVSMLSLQPTSEIQDDAVAETIEPGPQKIEIVAIVPKSEKPNWKKMLFPIWAQIYAAANLGTTKTIMSYAVASLEFCMSAADPKQIIKKQKTAPSVYIVDVQYKLNIVDSQNQPDIVASKIKSILEPNDIAIIMTERPVNISKIDLPIMYSRMPSASGTIPIAHSVVAVPVVSIDTKHANTKSLECTSKDRYKRIAKFRVIIDAVTSKQFSRTAFILMTSDPETFETESKRSSLKRAFIFDSQHDSAPADASIVVTSKPLCWYNIKDYCQSKTKINIFVDVDVNANRQMDFTELVLQVLSLLYEPSIINNDDIPTHEATLSYVITTPAVQNTSDRKIVLVNSERATRMCLDALNTFCSNTNTIRGLSAFYGSIGVSDYWSQNDEFVASVVNSVDKDEEFSVFWESVSKYMKRDLPLLRAYFSKAKIATAVSEVAAAAAEIATSEPSRYQIDPRVRDLTDKYDANIDSDDSTKEPAATRYIEGSLTLENYLRETIIDNVINREQLDISEADLNSELIEADLMYAEDLIERIKRRKEALFQSADNPIVDCLNEAIMAETGIVDKLVNVQTMNPIAAAYEVDSIIQTPSENDDHLLSQIVKIDTSLESEKLESENLALEKPKTLQEQIAAKFSEMREFLKNMLLQAKQKYLGAVESASSTENELLAQASEQTATALKEHKERINTLTTAAIKQYGDLKKSTAQQIQKLIPELQKAEFDASRADQTDQDTQIATDAVDIENQLRDVAMSGGNSRVIRRIEERRLYEEYKRAEQMKLKKLEISKQIEAIVTQFESDRNRIADLLHQSAAAERQETQARIEAIIAPIRPIFNRTELNPEINEALQEYAAAVVSARMNYMSQQKQIGRKYFMSAAASEDLGNDIEAALASDCSVVAAAAADATRTVDAEPDAKTQKTVEQGESTEPKSTRTQKNQKQFIDDLSEVSEFLSKWISSLHFAPASTDTPSLEMFTFCKALMYHTYYSVLRVPTTDQFQTIETATILRSIKDTMDPGEILNIAITNSNIDVSSDLTITNMMKLLHYWYDGVLQFISQKTRSVPKTDRANRIVELADLFIHQAAVCAKSDLDPKNTLVLIAIEPIVTDNIKTVSKMMTLGGESTDDEPTIGSTGPWLLMRSVDVNLSGHPVLYGSDSDMVVALPGSQLFRFSGHYQL